MEAIEIDATAQVDLNRCIGCGLCVTTCEDDAMRLRLKAEPEQSVPPKTLFHTYLSLAKERGKI
jgi:ferredoxin